MPSGYGDDNHGPCDHAHHYQNKEMAKRKASQLGLTGTHTMTCRGKTIHMPGSTHTVYERAMANGGVLTEMAGRDRSGGPFPW